MLIMLYESNEMRGRDEEVFKGGVLKKMRHLWNRRRAEREKKTSLGSKERRCEMLLNFKRMRQGSVSE